MKILVIGHCRHGKDTVAEMLAAKMNMKFESSSLAALDVIYPLLVEVTGEADKQKMFENRHQFKHVWKEAITLYNTPDRTSLAKRILLERGNNIYVGMRCRKEFDACLKEGFFNSIVYVDAGNRVPKDNSTLDIPFMPAIMHSIWNEGNLEELEEAVDYYVDSLNKLASIKELLP